MQIDARGGPARHRVQSPVHEDAELGAVVPLRQRMLPDGIQRRVIVPLGDHAAARVSPRRRDVQDRSPSPQGVREASSHYRPSIEASAWRAGCMSKKRSATSRAAAMVGAARTAASKPWPNWKFRAKYFVKRRTRLIAVSGSKSSAM